MISSSQLPLVSLYRWHIRDAGHDAVEIFPVSARGALLHAQAEQRQRDGGALRARDERVHADVFALGASSWLLGEFSS